MHIFLLSLSSDLEVTIATICMCVYSWLHLQSTAKGVSGYYYIQMVLQVNGCHKQLVRWNNILWLINLWGKTQWSGLRSNYTGFLQIAIVTC